MKNTQDGVKKHRISHEQLYRLVLVYEKNIPWLEYTFFEIWPSDNVFILRWGATYRNAMPKYWALLIIDDDGKTSFTMTSKKYRRGRHIWWRKEGDLILP